MLRYHSFACAVCDEARVICGTKGFWRDMDYCGIFVVDVPLSGTYSWRSAYYTCDSSHSWEFLFVFDVVSGSFRSASLQYHGSWRSVRWTKSGPITSHGTAMTHKRRATHDSRNTHDTHDNWFRPLNIGRDEKEISPLVRKRHKGRSWGTAPRIKYKKTTFSQQLGSNILQNLSWHSTRHGRCMPSGWSIILNETSLIVASAQQSLNHSAFYRTLALPLQTPNPSFSTSTAASLHHPHLPHIRSVHDLTSNPHTHQIA